MPLAGSKCSPPCATWLRASGCWSASAAAAPTHWRCCSSTSPTRARWPPLRSGCRGSGWTCWVRLCPVPPGWLGGDVCGVADPPQGPGSRCQIPGGAGGPGAGTGRVQRGRGAGAGFGGAEGRWPISREGAPPFLSCGTSTVPGSARGHGAAHGLCPAVCNAGVGLMGPLETCSDQAMKSLFDVNLFGAVRTIQAFLPAMKRRRAGRIIVSSSIGGLQGLPFNSVYCASKFAVEGLCESLAIVLRPFNIHLTLVECGPVNTSFLANLQRPDPEGSELQGLDAETRGLYRRYLRHCQSLFCDAAQEVDEVLQVSARGTGVAAGRCRAVSDPSAVPGVPGGHRHPLPAAALRHHPAIRPALAPEAGQPRRLRVRGRDARLRVRPRRGRRGPALSGAGGAAASVPAGGLGPAVSPIKPFAAARLPAPSLSLSTLGVPPPPPRAPAG
ncbi:17-beta-hydroxysteroid dehydrogenase type 1 isoform X2 [Strix aluco]|uniref:17-beta-hydroxysteroid dehydrogenase type 1 isoform X2 n=1 Tax=Strix aluco TaxID=111821 RepID=UPI003DA2CCCC